MLYLNYYQVTNSLALFEIPPDATHLGAILIGVFRKMS